MKDLLELGFKNISYGRHPGVYVLCYKGKVIYVGKTVNAFTRVGQHDKSIRFDQIFFIRCRLDELNDKEREYIHTLKPEANREYKTPEKALSSSTFKTSGTSERFSRDGYDVHAGGYIEICGVKMEVKKIPVR
jgi:hypothetical protein